MEPGTIGEALISYDHSVTCFRRMHCIDIYSMLIGLVYVVCPMMKYGTFASSMWAIG